MLGVFWTVGNLWLTGNGTNSPNNWGMESSNKGRYIYQVQKHDFIANIHTGETSPWHMHYMWKFKAVNRYENWNPQILILLEGLNPTTEAKVISDACFWNFKILFCDFFAYLAILTKREK